MILVRKKYCMELTLIVIKGEQAFSLHESGKMIPRSLSNRGEIWKIELHSEISDEGAHKNMLKKLYPNVPIVSTAEKKYSNVKRLFREAVEEEARRIEKAREDGVIVFSRHYFF